MEAELKRLAPRGIPGYRLPKALRPDEQNLLYPFDAELAWVATNYLRTPSRALWDLFDSDALRLELLYEDVADFIASDPCPWLPKAARFSVEVHGLEDFAASPLQVRGAVKNGLIEGARSRHAHLELDPEAPDIVFSVRGFAGEVRVSLDLGGASLHARGYRLDHGEAPLRENLAAQMLMLARWDARSEALIDPLAGSGTLAIEAALMAVGAPLWVPPRRPAAAHLPPFAAKAKAPLPELFPGTQPVVVANEIHTPTLEALERNAARAGVADRIARLHGDFRHLTVPRMAKAVGALLPFDKGLVVANPPYGERLEEGAGADKDLLSLYADLAEWFRGLGPGWRIALLSAHPAVEDAFGHRPQMKKPMSNGPIRAHFLLYDGAEL